MANSTIDFEEILAGQKGSEVSNIIMENLKKLSTRIVELEDEISNLKKQGFDGSTVLDQTGSVSVSYNPTVVIGKSLPTYRDEELVNDMMMLIASFSGEVYSLRAKENRNKIKENKNNES